MCVCIDCEFSFVMCRYISCCLFCFFFFKQKTAYEMRISDWSSDVCSSDLIGVVVYNRSVCRLNATHLEQLAERCPNLIGYKDGLGDIELMVSIRRRLDRKSVV